jgi:hypothetical protein
VQRALRIVLLGCGVLAACSAAPATVLLEIRAEPGVAPLDELRLSVLDANGIAVGNRRVPESGTPTLPGEVVLYPPPAAGPLRLWARGVRAGATVGEGAALVTPQPGRQLRASLTLKPGRLPDTDDDGVPDAVDSCPAAANPAQGPCPQRDAGGDGARDLLAPEAGLDAGRDLEPDRGGRDGALDRGKPDAKPLPDAPGPDKPKLDKPKLDKPKLDLLQPDASKLDKPKPDTRPPDLAPLPDVAPPLGWRYRVAVQVTNSGGALAGYQLVVVLGNSFSYAHAKSDGADLRFSTSSAGAGPFNLPHWIESWNAGGASKIWVRVSNVPAGSSTIYLFYGNPAGTSTASQSAVFPGRFVSTASVSLSGTKTYDWFELAPAHTLSLVAGQPLAISARKIVIKGSVDGNGAGYAGGPSGVSTGSGPGGGNSVSASGSGGGGHGGAGGAGGYDGTGPIAAGGVANGSATSAAIDMGSGGGGNDTAGGAGGGALTLSARDVEIAGPISLAGADVPGAPTAGQCSGGGAGGGLLLRGYSVTVPAAISLVGGKGGQCSGGADGGGGGGGGRFKLFYQSSQSVTGAVSLGGGAGGPGGDTPAQPGAAGSSHTAQASFEVTSVSLGGEVALW